MHNGIDLSKTSPRTDFGQGFYTTTVLYQAKDWAWRLAYPLDLTQPENLPVILQYEVERNELAKLDTLYFVLGSKDSEDFWSLIYHCRNEMGQGHGRPLGVYYDCVVGPVTADWRQRKIFQDADQISFHTETGFDILGSPILIEVED